MPIFTLDGKAYHAGVTEIERSFELVSGQNQATMKGGKKLRDVIGTEYSFTVRIEMQYLTPEDYDTLYWALSAPVDYHDVVMPFGQSTMEFRAGIENGSDVLKRMGNPENRWGELQITFVPEGPQRSAL